MLIERLLFFGICKSRIILHLPLYRIIKLGRIELQQSHEANLLSRQAHGLLLRHFQILRSHDLIYKINHSFPILQPLSQI